jgi:hypothetical protein
LLFQSTQLIFRHLLSFLLVFSFFIDKIGRVGHFLIFSLDGLVFFVCVVAELKLVTVVAGLLLGGRVSPGVGGGFGEEWLNVEVRREIRGSLCRDGRVRIYPCSSREDIKYAPSPMLVWTLPFLSTPWWHDE